MKYDTGDRIVNVARKQAGKGSDGDSEPFKKRLYRESAPMTFQKWVIEKLRHQQRRIPLLICGTIIRGFNIPLVPFGQQV